MNFTLRTVLTVYRWFPMDQHGVPAPPVKQLPWAQKPAYRPDTLAVISAHWTEVEADANPVRRALQEGSWSPEARSSSLRSLRWDHLSPDGRWQRDVKMKTGTHDIAFTPQPEEVPSRLR